MNSSLAIFAIMAFALAVAQQPDGSALAGGAVGGNPNAGRPSTGGGGGAGPVNLEQRTVDQQNQLLATAFARAFPEDTPAEFQPMVVALYVRCQSELDNCADFLWETHLLREYRNCAMTQRRLCTQETQELQAQLQAMADANNEQFELSPEEQELLAQLGY
ncbi:uncharacterized protein LOC128712296 [Anopheles marshallii]|uniref:uncharacterized protein LOC128712296 n=1 Tax=Anopheles marshallii TaxID=1521116 RepID=UPI00237B6A74|nr:uncharacterized protein LOC128712296 [Anopheles marshallii]